MKTPLRYQVTEYDCGTTSLLNSISFVLDREEIPAELVHEIMTYTLDNFGDRGGEGEGGTSLLALEFICHWMDQYIKVKDLALEVMLFEKDEAKLIPDKAEKLFKNNGCIFASVWLMGGPHYVAITNMDNEFAYIFDPYYVDPNYFEYNDCAAVIDDAPFTHNRKVKISQLFADNEGDYCLIASGEYEELMIIRRRAS